MSYKNPIKTVSSGVQGFKRNSTTGEISVLDRNKTQRPIKFIGYNDTYGNWAQKGDATKGTSHNSSYNKTKYLGYGNHNSPLYNPVRANARRIYINAYGAIVNPSSQPITRISPTVVAEDRKNFLFYFDSLFDLNIEFTDVTKSILTTTWDPAILAANTNGALKLNQWTPRFIVENNTTNSIFSVAGRLLGVGSASGIFPEVPSNSLGTTNFTITSNGSGLKVNGVAVASFTIPAAKLKVAKNAAQTYTIVNYGNDAVMTQANKGGIEISFTPQTYEYMDSSNSTDNYQGGVIFGRIRSPLTSVIATASVSSMGIAAGRDYYSNTSGVPGNQTLNPIRDLIAVRPIENANSDPKIMSKSANSIYLSDIWAKGDYSGNNNQPYYDYNTERQFEVKTRGYVAGITGTTDTQFVTDIKLANDFGIWTFVTAFWSFQNYGYSIYGGTKSEIRLNQLVAQQSYIDQIMTKIQLQIETVGYSLMILGNESNLESNLKGDIYGNTYGGSVPPNGGRVYFADMDNQDQQSNVNAMMKFFNDIAKIAKERFGDKVLIGPCLQMTSQGQVSEILSAKNAGFCSNFDVIFNNFYANGSTDNPFKTYTNFDPINYWNTNQGTNKLNMILSECGIPRKAPDISNLPAGYNHDGTTGYTTPRVNTGVVTAPYADLDTHQGNIAYGLINQSLKLGNYPTVQGCIFFCDGDQPGRVSYDQGAGVARYESFYIPPKNFVSLADSTAVLNSWINGYPAGGPRANLNSSYTPAANKLYIWAEEYMSHLWKDTPRVYNDSLSINQASAFEDSLLTLSAKETNAMVQTRAIIASGIPGLIYSNEL